jgi:hypothetical protein
MALTSLHDMISKSAIDALANHDHFGGEHQRSRSRESVLGLLAQVAVFLGMADRAASIRTTLNKELPKAGNGISFETLIAVSEFDDPQELARVIAGCAANVYALETSKKRRTALPLAQDSLTFVFVVTTFKMPDDMLRLRFRGPERDTQFGFRPTLVVDGEIAGDASQQNFESLLKANAVQLVDAYFFAAAAQLKRAPDWLFEKLDKKCRDRSTIGKGVAKVARSLGHEICWTTIREVSVKSAGQRGHAVGELTGAVGYSKTSNFVKRYGSLFDIDASERLIAVLGLDDENVPPEDDNA